MTGTCLLRCSRTDEKNRYGGFTLVEVVITMAIGAILLGIAAPSFSTFLNKLKLNSLSSAIESTLQEARSEAIKRNARVLVCAADSASTGCANATNWGRTGWLLCYDIDADDSCDASTETLPNPIRREKAIDTTVATVTGPAAAIRFNPTGSQGAVGSATATVSVTGTWSGAAALNITTAASGLIKGARAR